MWWSEKWCSQSYTLLWKHLACQLSASRKEFFFSAVIGNLAEEQHWRGKAQRSDVTAPASAHCLWRGHGVKWICQEWKSQTWYCSQRYDICLCQQQNISFGFCVIWQVQETIFCFYFKLISVSFALMSLLVFGILFGTSSVHCKLRGSLFCFAPL